VVIYRSWCVNTVCSLRLPASWPHELVAAIVGVIVIEEVVADTNEMM
jgi:hypothetical protein